MDLPTELMTDIAKKHLSPFDIFSPHRRTSNTASLWVISASLMKSWPLELEDGKWTTAKFVTSMMMAIIWCIAVVLVVTH
ncbi:hypothetical protein CAEBREN_20281 [Caenorhabditis brenneri]|uniref:Uncharacterized protein n=1 Tax=Caenorhabditis brenneri TaxID=135651 RepID=G0NGG1_CAEBE|nr:hypothetical protein CAEBREN_20281 [Caenorhabditis brenneri]